MKNLIGIGLLALTLAGCAGTPSPTAQKIVATIDNAVQTVKDTSATVQAKAKVAQNYATEICSYVPTIQSVIAIFNSGYSADAGIVANSICNAVTNIPLADGPGDHLPRVNGVVVKGKFIK